MDAQTFKRNVASGVLREVKKGKNTGGNKPKGTFSIGSPSFDDGKRYLTGVGFITSSSPKKECHTLSRKDVEAWLGLDVMSVDYCGKVWCMPGERFAKGSIKTMVHFDKFSVVVEHNMITCKFTTVADNYHGPGSLNLK